MTPQESPVIQGVAPITPELPPDPIYKEDQQQYAAGLQKRLELARIQRNMPYDEFDGEDYLTRYQNEDKDANAFIQPRTNTAVDTNYTSGTIRSKMLAVLAMLANYDFVPELQAFDEKDHEVDELGTAMGVVLEKCAELDDDVEKQIQRWYVLLAHGHVFVEEDWRCEYRNKKKSDTRWNGQAKDYTWLDRLEKVFEGPSRNTLYGPSVFLGSMRKYFIDKQPYIFTHDEISYEEAEALYGKWDMWKYVSKSMKSFSQLTQFNMSMFYNTWRLTQVRENRVEVLKYQDKWANEFQIILNGVMMLPVGFPLTEISPDGEYTIVQQNLEPITPQFALGRSMTSRLRNQVLIFDEMLRLLLLKAQRNFIPPLANLTGRVLSARVFMPGVVTYGVNPDLIKLMLPKEVDDNNQAELDAIKYIQESIDFNSVSPQFQGQKGSNDQTATETLELQRQAKATLGLIQLAVTLLEKKLAQRRVPNVLGNWFDPIDTEVDELRQNLKNIYRTASARRPLKNGKMGLLKVTPTDDASLFPKDDEARMTVSKKLYESDKKSKSPTQTIYIDQASVRLIPHIWRVNVTMRESPSTERSKLLFQTMLGQALQMFGPDNINLDYAKERFADAWQESESRLFKRAQQPTMNPALGTPNGQAANGQPVPPRPQSIPQLGPKRPSPQPSFATGSSAPLA